MRYNELDLTKMCPRGIPINTGDKSVKTRAINEYFLKGFEAWCDPLLHYAMSVQAPFSLEACMACSVDELKTLIEGEGLEYYPTNDHDTTASLLYTIATSGFGTENRIDAIVKYACNNMNVTGVASYEGMPVYHYALTIEGDLTIGECTPSILARINHNLNELAPAHMRFARINFIEDDETRSYVGIRVSDISYNFAQPVVGI